MEHTSAIEDPAPPLRIGPHIRAAMARETRYELRDNEVIYVDRRGPRVLRIPSSNPAVPIDRKTLKDFEKGIYTGDLSQVSKFLASRMIKNECLVVGNDGKYSIKRQLASDNDMEMDPLSFQTLDIWTGKPGVCTDRNIDQLEFYSVREDELPSYHSWKGDKLAKIEGFIEEDDDRPAKRTPLKKTSLDEFRREHFAKIDEEAANDPENLLRHMPSITPSDPNWQAVEEYFKWIFEERKRNGHPQIYKIISEEFVRSQQLLLIPAGNNSHRARIQEENTKRYERFLETSFKDKEDNLITKLTMLCFGLPIAPLNPINIEDAGGSQDKSVIAGESHSNGDALTVKRIMWSEKPLEFLDYYNERSYGYPILRTKKKYYDDSNPRRSQKDLERSIEAWKAARKTGPLPSEYGRVVCGNSLLSWQIGVEKRNLNMEKHKKPLPPNKQKLRLRGGGIESTSNFQSKKLLVYCAMGVFQTEDNITDLQRLVYRLFRTTDGHGCMVDLIPRVSPTFGATANTTTIAWHNITPEIFINEISPRLNDKIKWAVRIRVGGNSTDDCEPDEPNLVDLRINGRDEEVAYWRLPLNMADIKGINQKQDTFRNAVECLLQYHWKYILTWKIRNDPNQGGRLVLAAEAPSDDLWNATVNTLNTGQYVIIDLAIDSHMNEKPRLTIPGVINTDNSLPRTSTNDRQNPTGFAKLRTLVQNRTRPHKTAIRIWPKSENYAVNDTSTTASSVIIGAESGDRDEMDWSNDTVVARPEILDFDVVDTQDLKKTQAWSISGGPSLSEFRKVVAKLWTTYDPRTEYFGITQSMSNDTFIVGPEMTELQWRFQVFDWFKSDIIYVQRNCGTGLIYTMEQILGPLGNTFAAGGNLAVGYPQTVAASGIDIVSTGTNTVSSSTTPARTGTSVADGSAQGTSADGQAAKGTSGIDKWMQQYDKQYSQMQARRDAYVRDSSIYRGSNIPQISIFGRSRESNIAVGPGEPALYINPATPSEATRLRDQNRILQSMVIDRQEVCQICNEPLPIGRSNDAARRQHLEAHTQVIRKARNTSQNVGEIFYCDVCGGSTADIEREYPGQGASHARTCGKRAKYHSISHFCQYCGLDIWSDGLSHDSSTSHIGNCALHRRATLQGREQLYQQLLQRVTGQINRPQGVYTCHFQNCNEAFTSATSNVERGRHFLSHLDNDHKEEKICQFPECGADLTGRSDSEMVIHLAEHGKHICVWPGCGANLSTFSEKDVTQHMGEHCRKHCSIRGCSHVFSNANSGDELIQHLITHTRGRCQFPSCGHVFADGNSEEEQRQHLLTHTGARCHFPGCEHIFVDEASKNEHRKHLFTHTAGQAPAQNSQPGQPHETLDTVPQRVRDQYQGLALYCPRCLYKVTGQAKSMCRRHRKAPCNVQGHDNWLALTDAQLQVRKYQKNQEEQQKAMAAPAPNPQRGGSAGRGDNRNNRAAATTTRETRSQKRRNAADNNDGNDTGVNGGEADSNANPKQKRLRRR